MIPITEPDIRRTVSSGGLVRGRTYWRDGRVLGYETETLGNDAESVTAQVKGSGRNVYTVEIILDYHTNRLEIDADCTCPLGVRCKHIAAVLFTLQEDRPLARRDTFKALQQSVRALENAVNEPPAPKKAAAAPLGPELKRWLEQLKRARVAKSSPTEPGHCLLYVLDLHHPYAEAAVSLRISVVYTRLLKAGGYGKAYPATNRNAGYVTTEDHYLLRWLDVLRGGHGSGATLRNVAAEDFMARLLATGRCHWQDKDSPPLQIGPPCPAEVRWEVLSGGAQQLRFHPANQAEVLLPLAPPWYVDTAAGTCGPLHTDLPADLAGMVLEAPVVPPGQAEKLRIALADQLPVALPQPQTLRKARRQDIKPVPHLHLFNQEYPLKSHYFFRSMSEETLDIPHARLSFVYQGARVPAWPEDQAPLEHYDPDRGELLEIERDIELEKRARQRLRDADFVPMSSHHLYQALEVPDANRYDHIIAAIAGRHDEGAVHQALVLFSLEVAPQLRAEGWQIEMSEDYLFRVVDEEMLEEWYADIDEGSGIDWFGLELGIRVEGERVNLLPLLVDLLRNLSDKLGLEKLRDLPDDSLLTPRLEDGRILPLPVGRVRNILDVLIELLDQEPLDEEGRLRLQNLRAAQLAELEAAMGAARLRWFGGQRLLELGRKLRDFEGIEKLPPPEGFQTELRPYQQQGLEWLQFLREYHLGGILADDMGLGKTIQSLAHMLTEKQQGRLDKPCLVIAPTSLMYNWRMEANRFAPDLKVLVLHGPDRKQHFDNIADHDLVLTTYPLLPRDKATLMQHSYHLLILDEAQNIKNPKAKATQIVHQLKADHRLCLTGTPMENHLGELWSLCHFLMPGLLGDAQSFRHLFRTPIEKEGDTYRGELLSRRVRPFLLRRAKQDVVKELPEKTEIIRSVELEGAQLDLYETIRLTMHERVRKEIAAKGMARSQIIILDALLKLRQVCCDPRLLSLEAARKVTRSAKLEMLMDLVPEMVEEGRKILLFSQFTSMLSLIEAELTKQQIGYVKLTGQTRKRAEAIQAFQDGDVPLFLISLKAGGTGLNLTAADTVIHYDPWWNPAVENQATDRAHRIGQDKKVFVYKLLTAGTVEEKIQELQQRKQKMADALFSGKGDKAAQLSKADLEGLFEPL